MQSRSSWCAIALLVLGAGHAGAQQGIFAPAAPFGNQPQDAAPAPTPPGVTGWSFAPGNLRQNLRLAAAQDKGKEKEKEKEKEKGKEPTPQPAPPVEEVAAPEIDFAALAAPESAEASRGLNPRMISDLPGYFALKSISSPSSSSPFLRRSGPSSPFSSISSSFSSSSSSSSSSSFSSSSSSSSGTRVVVAGLGPVKVGENQSVMPEDRAFFTYNYFSTVRGSDAGPSMDIQRGVFGFEKTFMDGNASFAVRVPFFDARGAGISDSGLGDVSVLVNFAILHDRAGTGLTAGLMVTTPTGPEVDTIAGDIHPFLLQPFVGYRLIMDRFYLHGFSSVAIPTDSQVVMPLFNDIGVGYGLYRADGDRIISALIPTIELHITTPLGHREDNDPITVPDIFALTGGVHVGLFSNSMLTIGLTAPVSGPRPWNIEGVAQFNLRF